MEIRQLKYFLAIAEEKQITAAAKKLNMAQPPLSYQLRLLEQELGVQLVERGARSVRLTGAGELLRKRAEQILALADAAQKEVGDCKNGLAGILSVGTISSSGSIVVGDKMKDFIGSHPGIRFEIHEGNTFAVLEMLEKGIIEIGIVRTPFQPKDMNVRYAAVEPMAAVMTAEHRCGQADDAVTLRELSGRPLIYYRRFDSLLTGVFHRAGIEPVVVCHNDDARTTIMWAQAGFGVGIVPRSAVRISGPGNLLVKEIRCEELHTRLAVIWPKKRYLSSLGRQFAELF